MANYSTPAPPSLVPPPIAGTHHTPHATVSLGRGMTAAIIVFILATCALGATAVIAPKFEQIFHDFGVALPELSRLFLSLGRVLRTPIGLISAAAVIGLLCATAGTLAYTRRSAFWLILVLAIAGFLIYQGLFVLSMYGPNSELGHALQQSAPTP